MVLGLDVRIIDEVGVKIEVMHVVVMVKVRTWGQGSVFQTGCFFSPQLSRFYLIALIKMVQVGL